MFRITVTQNGVLIIRIDIIQSKKIKLTYDNSKTINAYIYIYISILVIQKVRCKRNITTYVGTSRVEEMELEGARKETLFRAGFELL